jgi:hypothetical protein
MGFHTEELVQANVGESEHGYHVHLDNKIHLESMTSTSHDAHKHHRIRLVISLHLHLRLMKLEIWSLLNSSSRLQAPDEESAADPKSYLHLETWRFGVSRKAPKQASNMHACIHGTVGPILHTAEKKPTKLNPKTSNSYRLTRAASLSEQ